ncbi:MAG: hypothetical protein QOH68_1661 [Nocardioidaceae bacterium]|jgi:hypothetical protein|nr:hypothetical protein [Nocardioidaceae bacterium]
MTGDPSDPGPARRRRRLIVVVGVMLLAVLVSGIAMARDSDDHPIAGLEVGWGGSEGHPSCVYDPADGTAEATITIDGYTPRPKKVTVTVTAYSDENTSQPVGSSSRSVRVEGTVHDRLVVTVPVEKPPLVDIDGETACGRTVKYGHP